MLIIFQCIHVKDEIERNRAMLIIFQCIQLKMRLRGTEICKN